ncbi:MAG: PEP-CTERM sorting domain-containing protein [Bryobacteraceae bacterium]
MSKGAWILPGGNTYDIDISVVRLADGFSTGFGFVRIDPYLESEVPEPGTITLLSIGAVLLLIGHKRIRAC